MKPSKFLNPLDEFLPLYRDGICFNKIRNFTGLSRATLYRRMKSPGFPSPKAVKGQKFIWDFAEIADWISRHNQQIKLGYGRFVLFERDLEQKGFADPELRTSWGKTRRRWEIIYNMRKWPDPQKAN